MSIGAILGTAVVVLFCLVVPLVVAVSASMLSARISEAERRAGMTEE